MCMLLPQKDSVYACIMVKSCVTVEPIMTTERIIVYIIIKRTSYSHIPRWTDTDCSYHT